MERLLKYFEPEKYVLDLEVQKAKKYIGGKVTVFGRVKAEEVKFHAVGMKIRKVLVNDEVVNFEHKNKILKFKVKNLKHEVKNFSTPVKMDVKILRDEIKIFETQVEFSEVKVEIFYDGKLNENMQGAYLSTYEYEGRTETIVATQFESHYAREAFPCIDEPAAKAVFELTIGADDAGDLVLANTPVLREADGKVMFEPTPRMSTYLVAFVIGKFHGATVKNAHGVEITTYAALNQDVRAVNFANEIAAKSLEFYDDNFGVPYPLPKLTQVALPDFEAGAMENWGLVTYRESMLLAGESATIGTKKSVALTVAHELSHQWFGDLVTMEWWDDLWLNESFASVMEFFAVDFIHPEYKNFEGFFTGDALAALKRDCLSGVQAVHQDVSEPAEIATLFDPAIVYAKGARLMLMVIRMMGWEQFCKGLADYFKEHQYQNTVGDDLWRALSKYAEFDVRGLMHGFIDRLGYPVITMSAGAAGTQRRFLLDGEMTDEEWEIGEIREDMSGHYILNLSEAEFDERLARFEKLGLEEKLRLLIDRDLVTKTDLAESGSLLPLLMKFKNEESAAVWNIILTIVSGLKIFFEPGAEEERYKKFVGELSAPKLMEIGLATREGDDENTIRLRSVLLALSFYAKREEDLKELAAMYDKDFRKMDVEVRDDILDAKIYLEPEMLDEYLEAYKTEADPEIKAGLLYAGTLMKDEAGLMKMMGLLNQPEIVKPQDQFYLFLYLYRNSRTKAKVFSWLTENWEYVREMAGEKSLENYPRYTAGSVRTEAEFKAWREFFEPLSSDPALKRATEVGKNEILARLRLISADREGVLAELSRLGF